MTRYLFSILIISFLIVISYKFSATGSTIQLIIKSLKFSTKNWTNLCHTVLKFPESKIINDVAVTNRKSSNIVLEFGAFSYKFRHERCNRKRDPVVQFYFHTSLGREISAYKRTSVENNPIWAYWTFHARDYVWNGQPEGNQRAVRYQCVTYELPMDYHCVTYELPMDYHCVTYEFPLDYNFVTYGFPMDYHCVTYELPMDYHCVTYELPIDYHCVTYELQMDYHCVTYEFPMDYHCVTNEFSMDYHCVTNEFPMDYHHVTNESSMDYHCVTCELWIRH